MATPKKKLKGSHCFECRGHRLHTVRVLRDPAGKVTRDLICSACDTVSRLGICCPKCGDTRMKQTYTRYRGTATVRVRACQSCGHRIRTKEVIEAGAG